MYEFITNMIAENNYGAKEAYLPSPILFNIYIDDDKTIVY
jgi:hypothetical protein